VLYIKKQCKVCNELKLLDWFKVDGVGTLHPFCRLCRRDLERAHEIKRSKYYGVASIEKEIQELVTSMFQDGKTPMSFFGLDWDQFVALEKATKLFRQFNKESKNSYYTY